MIFTAATHITTGSDKASMIITTPAPAEMIALNLVLKPLLGEEISVEMVLLTGGA
jgi:hypothetical protein